MEQQERYFSLCDLLLTQTDRWIAESIPFYCDDCDLREGILYRIFLFLSL